MYPPCFPQGQLGASEYQLYGAGNGSTILMKMLKQKIEKTGENFLFLDRKLDISDPETGQHLVSLHEEFTSKNMIL